MKTWITPGGVHPADNKRQSLTKPIGTLPIPQKLLIPLNQHIGAPAVPCVELGQSVLKGQKIAQASGPVSVPAHAPTSGTVSAIEHRPIAHPSALSDLCIEITSDGKDQWLAHKGLDNFDHTQPSKLLEIIAEAGIAGMGGAGFPSALKLNPGRQRPIDTLIINAAECEPYITADDSAIRERSKDIVEGIRILSFILGHPSNILLGIEDNKPQAMAALAPHVRDTGISVVSFPSKYPSGGEKQLVYILTGKEIPSGQLPADIGVVCINLGTTYAIKRAIIDGEPLLSRVTTLTGKACAVNRNYELLIGTPVSHLLAHNKFDNQACSRLIMGGPMMGFGLTSAEVPIVKTSNCILAASHSEMSADEPSQPCMRCGLCAEACPASLLPQQLLWYAQARDFERLETHHLFDCIECGACAYVCPSNIPLVQYYRNSKGEMLKARTEKIKSDRARKRFEFHQQRIEQAEKAKQARREAAKQAQAKADASGRTSGSSSAADIIAAAQARAATKQLTPQQQQAKAERAIARAEMRLQMSREKLAASLTDSSHNEEQRNTLSAAVENAQQKLEQATARSKKHGS